MPGDPSWPHHSPPSKRQAGISADLLLPDPVLSHRPRSCSDCSRAGFGRAEAGFCTSSVPREGWGKLAGVARVFSAGAGGASMAPGACELWEVTCVARPAHPRVTARGGPERSLPEATRAGGISTGWSGRCREAQEAGREMQAGRDWQLAASFSTVWQGLRAPII